MSAAIKRDPRPPHVLLPPHKRRDLGHTGVAGTARDGAEGGPAGHLPTPAPARLLVDLARPPVLPRRRRGDLEGGHTAVDALLIDHGHSRPIGGRHGIDGNIKQTHDPPSSGGDRRPERLFVALQEGVAQVLCPAKGEQVIYEGQRRQRLAAVHQNTDVLVDVGERLLQQLLSGTG